MAIIGQNDSSILIDGPSGAIEARVTPADTTGLLAGRGLVAVICHPHPVHGGTMDNKVVTTLARVYRDLGITVVRFNFRGVGASDGVFDNAVGEVEDLLAVIGWLNRQYPDAGLLLAGFSFGSSIAAQASHRVERVHHLLLVAPPVERYPFDRDGRFPCPVLIVQGGGDERVVAEGVYAWSTTLGSPVALIRYDEAGHFFHGFLTHLKQDLMTGIPGQIQ